MDKVYLVMMFNYPYAIFENMNDAIDSCKEHVQKFGQDQCLFRHIQSMERRLAI